MELRALNRGGVFYDRAFALEKNPSASWIFFAIHAEMHYYIVHIEVLINSKILTIQRDLEP